MKKIVTENILCKIFCFISTLVFIMLFYYSMMETWVNSYDLKEEYVYVQKDMLIFNIVALMAVILVAGLLYMHGQPRIGRINMDIAAVTVCICSFIFSVYWVVASDTMPQADQEIACLFAEAFENGDFEGLQKGQYVGIYRHQLGLITFLRLLLKLFGEANYLVFQYLNAMMVPILIFSGYQITKRLSEHNKVVELFYLLLMVTCVPLYCYVPFVYGEIISTTMVIFAAWMLMESLEKFSLPKLTLMSIALGAAVQFRRNTLIFLIAFLIVTVMQLFRGWNWRIPVTAFGILACTLILQLYMNATYQPMTPEDSLEAPASVYIAMGVNNDNGMAGWHNYYDQIAFGNNDWNVEKTNEEAWKYLGDFFREHRDEPGYIMDFYYRKTGSQWNSPMYQCLAMNNNIKEQQSAFAASVYFGKLRNFVEAETNIHQLVVYGGVLCLLLFVRKRWQRIDNYLLLIGVFGGFLFSILWEAKTRYVFPYYLAMLPYGAAGIYELVKWLYEKYKKYVRKEVAE